MLATRSRLPVLELVVRNETDDNFTAVEVLVSIPGRLAAFFDSVEVEMPKAPVPWGTPTHYGGALSAIRMPSFDRTYTPDLTFNRGHIDNSGSAVITFPTVDLRPEEEWELDLVMLVMDHVHAGETIRATWKITSTSASGTSKDQLDLVVEPEAVDPLGRREG